MKKLCIALLMTGLAGVCHASDATLTPTFFASLRSRTGHLDLSCETAFPAATLTGKLVENNRESDLDIVNFIPNLGYAALGGSSHLREEYAVGYLLWLQNVLDLVSSPTGPIILSDLEMRFAILTEFHNVIFFIHSGFPSLKNLCIQPLEKLLEYVNEKQSDGGGDYSALIWKMDDLHSTLRSV